MPSLSKTIATSIVGLAVLGGAILGLSKPGDGVQVDRTVTPEPASTQVNHRVAVVQPTIAMRSDPVQPRAAAAGVDTVEKLRLRLDATQEMISDIKTQLGELKSLLAADSRYASQEEAGDWSQAAWAAEVDDTELAKEIEEELEYVQRLSRIDELESEAVDQGWSEWAEAELNQSLDLALNADPPDGAATSALEGLSVLGNECFSSFCRVEVDLASDADREAVVGQLLTYVPWEAQAFYQPESPEGSGGTFYISRGNRLGEDTDE